MGSTQTSSGKKHGKDKSNGKGSKRYDFARVDDFDVKDMAPDAAEGGYEAVIDDVEVMGTSKDNYPMIRIDWKQIGRAHV